MAKAPFKIGQTFDKPYPAEAAFWANANSAQIIEVSPGIYEIQAKPVEPAPEEPAQA